MAYTNYTIEDAHQAVLNHGFGGYDGLHYMFYPYDYTLHNEKFKENMLDVVVSTFNKAGFHVHAWQCVMGGFDLWVEREYINNRWGDREVNRNYSQDDMPVFHDDLPNEL